MRKLRRLRERAGWTASHFLQLACSHDFFGDGWGALHALPPDELPDVVRDMAACWRQHEADVRAECKPREPWFAAYAGSPQTLIDELTNHAGA